MEEFQSGGGQTIDYALHVEVRLLKLLSYHPKECLKVGGTIVMVIVDILRL